MCSNYKDGPMYQYIDIYGNKLFTSDYRYVTSFINGTTVVYDGEDIELWIQLDN